MTDAEWKEKLVKAVAGKSGDELRAAKKQVFQDFASGHPDEYAWKNGERKKPTGSDYVASKIIQDMRRVFGELYESSLADETARFVASMYY